MVDGHLTGYNKLNKVANQLAFRLAIQIFRGSAVLAYYRLCFTQWAQYTSTKVLMDLKFVDIC